MTLLLTPLHVTQHACRFVFEGNRIAGDTAPAEVSHAGAGCSKLAVVEQHAVSPWLEF